MPDKGGGVKPPLIGKFTGRVRTPLTIFAAFFALGVVLDIIFEWLARNVIKQLQTRVEVGFPFWALAPEGEGGRTSIAYDDIILILITALIFFIYKIRLKNRAIAAAGFFFGWYASSMWISPKVQEAAADIGNSSATEGM